MKQIDDESQRQPLKQAVVAVIYRDGKFLGIKRSANVRAPGKICFPGGTIESGETVIEALHREIREELGVRVEVREKIWEYTTSWNVQVHWLEAKLLEESFRIDKNEVQWCRWMTSQQFTQSDELLESNCKFFDALQSGEIKLSV